MILSELVLNMWSILFIFTCQALWFLLETENYTGKIIIFSELQLILTLEMIADKGMCNIKLSSKKS